MAAKVGGCDAPASALPLLTGATPANAVTPAATAVATCIAPLSVRLLSVRLPHVARAAQFHDLLELFRNGGECPLTSYIFMVRCHCLPACCARQPPRHGLRAPRPHTRSHAHAVLAADHDPSTCLPTRLPCRVTLSTVGTTQSRP